MLKRCNLNLDQNPYGEVEAQGLEGLIKKEFPKDQEAIALVETTSYAKLLPLAALKVAEVLPKCQRLIISDQEAELRLEAKGSLFSYRLLREMAGDNYCLREDLLLLRQSSNIDAKIYAEGLGRMRSREYYKENDSGMYVFVAERLAGLSAN